MSKEAYDVVNAGAGIVGAACVRAFSAPVESLAVAPAQQSIPAFGGELQ